MNANLCPDRPTLEAFLLGTLDVPAGEAIDTHLDACAGCLATLDALDAAVNQPFHRLCKPASDEGACGVAAQGPAALDEPALRQLVAEAKRIGQAPLEADSLANQTLGNYQLLEPIGAGGMGRVFKARHLRLKKTVAVKVLAPALVRSEEGRRRFQREIEAVGRLASPHIVTAFDADQVAGRDFLVMEYVEGKNLAEVVQAHAPLSIERALDYILQAARGLAHAHGAGIIHRDVKPSNLLLDSAGTVKVLDLGLARIFNEGDTPAASNSANVIMGTVAFMAPEQAFDTHHADARADIYSLGCTLYFLATGTAPYEGKTPLDVLAAHRDQPIPSLPDAPSAVTDLLRRLMAKKPDDRPASMAHVITELENIQTHGLVAPRHVRRFARRGWIAACVAIAACVPLAFAMWSAFGGAKTDDKKDGPIPKIDMVRIAAGEFWMGASETDLNAQKAEKPRQKVKINHAFFLGKTEITQAQYVEIMGNNPSAFSAKGLHRERVKNVDTSNHPVESVSWFDAVRFCNKLSERHELKPYYQIKDQVVTIRGGDGYRLPTEAEWECACRAGASTTWSFGEKIGELTEHAWFAENSEDRTHPVARKKANPFGLYDMYGNVREWCWDRFDAGYYQSMPASDPAGSGTSNTRTSRGGAWNTRLPRTTAREGLGFTYGAEGSINIIGFRVARSVAP